MRYRARAPLRIDFAGGWTDVPLYAEEHGGAVLNAAITHYLTGSLSRPDAEGILGALRGDRSYLSYSLRLPAGSGLGTMAAENVLWLALVKVSVANTSDRREIADMACRLSNMLGILGGKQNEYASALGGIHFLSFDAGVQAERIELRPALLDEMRSRLVLVYGGRRRPAGAIGERVWSRYRAGAPDVLAALDGLKRVAEEMRGAMTEGNLDAVSDLMLENWSYQKELDDWVTTRDLDSIVELGRAHGARGGKACGAGGGGCLLFMAERDEGERLRSAFRARRLKVIDFDFDTYGVFVSKG